MFHNNKNIAIKGADPEIDIKKGGGVLILKYRKERLPGTICPYLLKFSQQIKFFQQSGGFHPQEQPLSPLDFLLVTVSGF